AVCPAGLYGRECENRCNCAKDGENCFVSTGGCPSGCAAGYHWEGCRKRCDERYFGIDCSQQCSTNCTNQHCRPTDGTCFSCIVGKQGPMCDADCTATLWGDNCTMSCSADCKDQLCNAVNGTCFSCVAGKSGENCSEEDPPVAAIVGPVIAFAVLVALIVIGVIFWRRRRHKKDGSGQAAPHGFTKNAEIDINFVSTAMKNTNDIQAEKDGRVNHVGSVYYNHVSGCSETAIRFDDLDHFLSTHGREFFQKQFNSILANSSASTKAAMSPENVNKNRYKNISAYDHSRVHLQTDVLKSYGDYINASYIDGYQQKKQFIASQGATKINLEDFVRMLWEQEVEVVVMLTILVEGGKLKCEQYWPNDGEITIGEVTVKLTTTQVFADYTIRRLCLYKKAPPVHVLTHFHFTTWPDKDIPTTAWGLVDLEQRVAAISTSKPIVVHCSAGVGRTGTFIALHNTLEQIKDTGYMDVFTTVQKLRQDRINMVQTFQQYEFLHKAVQIAMVCKGTTVTTRDIRDRIHALELAESGQSILEMEFKDEQHENEEVRENNTYCNSRLLTNRMKNRLDNVLPKEYFRPNLRCETQQLGNYINAVLIPSCEKHDHQILTQLPLPTTVIDFWRLVTQYKVSLIVAFERNLNTVDQTIADYLPETEGETKTCSFFNIKTTGLDSRDTWDVHRITI
ncbi:unnamed protein product, partial [Candidula unifasciata]